MNNEKITCFLPHELKNGAFVPNVLLRYEGISQSAKIVWGILAQYSEDNDLNYLSQKTIAKEVGLSTSRTRKILYELEKKGFIKKISPKGEDRLYHKTNRYIILNHKIFQDELKKE